MKKSFIYALLLLLLAGGKAHSQIYDSELKYNVDSLKQIISQTKNDTTRLRLRYWLGRSQKTARDGFWDSLGADAQRLNRRDYELKVLLFNAFRYRYYTWNGDKALQNAFKAYDMATQNRDNKTIKDLLRSIASIYLMKNDVKTALDYCFKGLKLAEEMRDKNYIAKFYELSGICYFDVGDIKKAIATHLKCLQIYREIKDRRSEMYALFGIGEEYFALNDKASTIKYYLAVKPFLAEFVNSAEVMAPTLAVGSAYSMLGQFDSSQKYCWRAYHLAEALGNTRSMVSVLVTIGSTYLNHGDIAMAKKTALQAMELFKTIDFKVQGPPLAQLLKDVYMAEKDYKKALEAYGLYVNFKDSITSENNRKQVLEKEFNYELDKKENAKKLLEQENSMQSMALDQDRRLLAGMGILLVLILLIAWLFFRQNKFKNEQQSMLLEQKLLRSQMNPHFIFNSLQAVQNFILKEDKQRAASYLGSFAGIMRNVLENSRLEAITLKKEIALLENYLQLQKLRFGQRFDYEIKMDETIDPETIYIPPMLAQPFIENAVEHGFHGIESGGLITITYALQNNALLMEISDNGVGMNDNYSGSKKHQSLTIGITRERMTLINKKAKGRASFKVSEAFPQQKERKGVKVSFSIPLNITFH